MNSQRVKALKDMAALFWQMQPQGVPKKTVEQIYNELKVVHKNKKQNNGNKTPQK